MGADPLANLGAAYAWLDGVMAETRRDLALVEPGSAARFRAAGGAADLIAARVKLMGATVHQHTTPPRMTWHGVTVSRSEGGIALFDAWLNKARNRIDTAGAA